MRIEVGREDLARCRFAISPLWELVNALRLLDRPSSAPAALRPWLRRARPRYRKLRQEYDVDAVLALQQPHYGVDFLCPAPTGVAATIEQLIDEVRSTSLDQAHADVRRALHAQHSVPARLRRILTGPRVTGYLADVLAAAWDLLLAEEWPLLRALLERDVVHRAERLVSAGWAAALADLHPRLRWEDAAIVSDRWPVQRSRLDGRGLLFVPSVFVWPGLAVTLEPPWPPALVYPARGVAALWSVPTESASLPALAKLLGARRAALLVSLDDPATTSQLATSHGQSLGGAAGHLAVLLDAGLVTKARAGRLVMYRRSAAGDALVAAAGASAS